jgi:hypothetical protein
MVAVVAVVAMVAMVAMVVRKRAICQASRGTTPGYRITENCRIGSL